MSTHINDFAAAVAVYPSVQPSAQTGAVSGDAVDLIAADGECFAIQQIGTFGAGPTWNGSIEESTDGSTGWTAISGAAFAAVTAEENTQVIRFTRTKRFVRYVATVSGGTPNLTLAVLIGEQRKTF